MNKSKFKQEIPLHIMLLIPLALVIVYCYGPMLGLIMAFQDFVPTNKGFFSSIFNSEWVGLDQFKLMFLLPDTVSILWNTIFIATMKIVAKIIFPLVFALLLNEITKSWYKKPILYYIF